jgi:hypothetical protein
MTSTASENPAPFVRYTKTFKKYKDEAEPRVIAYVREWAQTQELFAFHEDNSIIKVTGSLPQVQELLDVLKSRFNYIPPEDRKDPGDAKA